MRSLALQTAGLLLLCVAYGIALPLEGETTSLVDARNGMLPQGDDQATAEVEVNQAIQHDVDMNVGESHANKGTIPRPLPVPSKTLEKKIVDTVSTTRARALFKRWTKRVQRSRAAVRRLRASLISAVRRQRVAKRDEQRSQLRISSLKRLKNLRLRRIQRKYMTLIRGIKCPRFSFRRCSGASGSGTGGKLGWRARLMCLRRQRRARSRSLLACRRRRRNARIAHLRQQRQGRKAHRLKMAAARKAARVARRNSRSARRAKNKLRRRVRRARRRFLRATRRLTFWARKVGRISTFK